MSGILQGYGVLVTDEWLHCGSVANSVFADGKRVSVNWKTNEMKLVNT